MCSKEEARSPLACNAILLCLKAIQKCACKKTLFNPSINSGHCRQIAFDVNGI